MKNQAKRKPSITYKKVKSLSTTINVSIDFIDYNRSLIIIVN